MAAYQSVIGGALSTLAVHSPKVTYVLMPSFLELSVYKVFFHEL